MGLYITRSPDETMALGRRLGATLRGGETLAFTGGLGVGKTTFCRGIAEGLGVVDPVSSPTFSLVNHYRGPIPFAHFDAYRIEGEEDLEAAGFYAYRAEGAVIAVEWSENISDFLEPPLLRISLRILPQDAREITIEGAAEF